MILLTLRGHTKLHVPLVRLILFACGPIAARNMLGARVCLASHPRICISPHTTIMRVILPELIGCRVGTVMFVLILLLLLLIFLIITFAT